MQQFAQRRYGDATVLRLEDANVPTPKRGHVLVQVHASSVNSGDVRVMRGDPLLVRLFFGLRRPRSSVRGMDVAGVIRAVGPDTDGHAIGERIVAEAPGGAFAEFVSVPAQRCVRLPDDVTDTAAATLPVAGGTALLALERTALAAGEKALVLGASGGVGHFAVQLAAHAGAHVTAVLRTDATEHAAAWGAERTIPRGVASTQLAKDGAYDVIIDVSGDRPLRELQSLLAPGGRVALVAGDGGHVLGPIPRLLRAMLLTRKRARLVPISASAHTGRLMHLVQALSDGHIAPHIAQTYAFTQIPDAVAALDRGEAVGKVVIRA